MHLLSVHLYLSYTLFLCALYMYSTYKYLVRFAERGQGMELCTTTTTTTTTTTSNLHTCPVLFYSKPLTRFFFSHTPEVSRFPCTGVPQLHQMPRTPVRGNCRHDCGEASLASLWRSSGSPASICRLTHRKRHLPWLFDGTPCLQHPAMVLMCFADCLNDPGSPT